MVWFGRWDGWNNKDRSEKMHFRRWKTNIFIHLYCGKLETFYDRSDLIREESVVIGLMAKELQGITEWATLKKQKTKKQANTRTSGNMVYMQLIHLESNQLLADVRSQRRGMRLKLICMTMYKQDPGNYCNKHDRHTHMLTRASVGCSQTLKQWTNQVVCPTN